MCVWKRGRKRSTSLFEKVEQSYNTAENYVTKATNYSATIHEHELSYDSIVYCKTKHSNIDTKLLA